MAKHAYRRWRGWRTEASQPSTHQFRNEPRKKKGITNAQAKFLADLQRAAGAPYTGSGMSCAEASAEIDRLLDARRRRRT